MDGSGKGPGGGPRGPASFPAGPCLPRLVLSQTGLIMLSTLNLGMLKTENKKRTKIGDLQNAKAQKENTFGLATTGAAEKVRGVPWAPSLPALSPAVTLLRSLLPLISELSPPPGPGAPTAPRVTIGLSSTSPRHVPSKRMNDAVCYYPDHLTHRCTIREYIRPFDGCSRYENQQM